MKHKLIAWIVCIALLIGLFGCSAVPEDHRSEPEHDAAISEPEPKEDEVTTPKEEPETEVTPEPETEQKPETVLGIDGLYANCPVDLPEAAPEVETESDSDSEKEEIYDLFGEEATQNEMQYNSQGVLLVPMNKACYVHLDDDGKRERVYVFTTEKEYFHTELHVAVDGVCYDDVLENFHLESGTAFYAITDIDRDDGHKEIAIMDPGPSADYSTSFIGYDKGNAWAMGMVEGVPDAELRDNYDHWLNVQLCVNGDGTVGSYIRFECIQTQYYNVDYVLQDGILQMDDEGFHTVRDYYKGYVSGREDPWIRPVMDIWAWTSPENGTQCVLPKGAEFEVVSVTLPDVDNLETSIWVEIWCNTLNRTLYLEGKPEPPTGYSCTYTATDGTTYSNYFLFDNILMSD